MRRCYELLRTLSTFNLNRLSSKAVTKRSFSPLTSRWYAHITLFRGHIEEIRQSDLKYGCVLRIFGLMDNHKMVLSFVLGLLKKDEWTEMNL